MQALVLGGGGFRGSYEMGVWKALIDLGEEIDIVAGTSIGAINGALIAQGDYKLASKLWTEFDVGEMLGVDGYKEKGLREKIIISIQTAMKELPEGGFGLDASDFRATLSKLIDEKRVRESKMIYGLVTVDLDHLVPVEKTINEIPDGKLIDYIMASSAIVPALKPYEIDGKRYIDGAYYDNIPLELAQKQGATKFIVVDLNSFGRIKKKSIKNIDNNNIRYIRCYWDLGFGLILDENIVERNITLGYYDTLKQFDAFEGNAYTFIKGSRYVYMDAIGKEGELAKKFGVHYSRTKITFEDKLIQAKWKLITDEREKKGGRKTNDMMASTEIIGEILGIDPTKIYTVESMDRRIKEELAKVQIPDQKNRDIKNPKTLLKNLVKDLETIADDKKRLKIFALEIKKSIQNKESIALQPIAANLYTRTYVGGMYLALRDLV